MGIQPPSGDELSFKVSSNEIRDQWVDTLKFAAGLSSKACQIIPMEKQRRRRSKSSPGRQGDTIVRNPKLRHSCNISNMKEQQIPQLAHPQKPHHPVKHKKLKSPRAVTT